MKNKFLRSIYLAVTVSLSSIPCLYSMSLGKTNPEIVYRGQTKEEDFSYVTYLIKELPWFNENGYNNNGHKVSLPMHKDFERFYQNPALLDEQNTNSLRQLFYEEIYDASKFDASVEALRQTEDVVKKALQKLAVLQTNWGFKIKQQYDILLTLYGPGGSYWLTDDMGIVKIKIGWTLQSNPWFLNTVVHEMVHIGIEENIVRKYNLSHWEKERLIDLICSLYLKDLLPWYKNQEITDTPIDNFINEEAIIENLPAAIETFIAQYPRDNSGLNKIS